MVGGFVAAPEIEAERLVDDEIVVVGPPGLGAQRLSITLAVGRGHGIAACSRFAVEAELRSGALDLISPPGWNVRRTISIIRVRDAAITPSAQQFLRMLRARWGDQTESDGRGAAPPSAGAAPPAAEDEPACYPRRRHRHQSPVNASVGSALARRRACPGRAATPLRRISACDACSSPPH